MSRIESRLPASGEAYERNMAAYGLLRGQIAAARDAALLGGGAEARAKQAAKGKLSPRERLSLLLDPGTPFLEIGQLAGHEVYDHAVPCAGIVTGIGIVAGHAVAVFANDASVKGGTYYPLTLRKHLRTQDIARELGLPCLYLVDSGGVYLPLQEEIFPDEHHFGRIFRNIAEMSALGLPQISAVLGSCTAGGAYIPAMSDETIIVRGNGSIFLGGPQLVRAATGVIVDAETLGGADIHTRDSGVADHYAVSDEHAIQLLRDIVARRGVGRQYAPPQAPVPPRHDPAELPGIISANPREHIPAREILARLLDDSAFAEYRARFGTSILCGTGHVGGYPVGVLINDGVLFSESAQKAANFIEICSQRGIPLLFLHNINGFMVGAEYEAGGIAKHGAKMVNAASCARVPKFSILIGGSYGAGNLAMCGRSIGPQLMAMWPNAKTTVVGGEQAATVLALIRAEQLEKQGKSWTAEEEETFKRPIREAYERQGQALYVASRLWVDAIVDPAQTREWLALSLALATAMPARDTRFGVFRM
ncbi:carboxyl transferase domain-containing protein [Chromobacterium phragmitis]|uniref:Methylcrotonoyl-CoA carboxylase n=1 Tax=Chromobacterium phragmitis TaxID=2202141 RepID=A0A344UCS0_9NEIS|nr:carboxyl transferase domain-containing protein [Chromobacterium phragmitis]AXE33068.1 methylcrotonoyl-CoA carboxylase [Chromobacterium phragmitis]